MVGRQDTAGDELAGQRGAGVPAAGGRAARRGGGPRRLPWRRFRTPRCGAREAGIRDLTGLEGAAGLKRLDLGGNPLADLRALAALNLDGARPDLWELATLAGLRRLSLRHNGLDDLRPLASLAELGIAGNRIGDFLPLEGPAGLIVAGRDGPPPPDAFSERPGRAGRD